MRKLCNKVGPWVSGNDFFDREREVDRLTQLIHEGNNVLLVAPRRVGKTSLVRECFRKMDERGEFYSLFVDVQHCDSPEEVIVAVSLAAQPHRNLAKKVQDTFSAFFNTVTDRVESVSSSTLLELRFREGIAGDWRAKGSKVMQHLAEADRRVVICLDELPIMITRLLTKPREDAFQQAELFLSWLRLVMSSHQGRVQWIVCGSIGLEPVLARHNLSFSVAQLRPFHLGPWDRETAEACLISLASWEGSQWSEPSRHALLDQLAYFVPHHLQMYYAHVMDECRLKEIPTPDPELIKRVYQTHMLSTRGHAELADYEERLLRVLDKEQVQLALAFLTEAAVHKVLTFETAKRLAERDGLGSPHKAVEDVLRVLEHDGYLSNQTSGRVFVSPLIRDWWKQRFGQSYTALTEEE